MDIQQLLERIRSASETYSLRELAKLCDVSHEQIRRLASADKKEPPNITLAVFNKIEAGLSKNEL